MGSANLPFNGPLVNTGGRLTWAVSATAHTNQRAPPCHAAALGKETFTPILRSRHAPPRYSVAFASHSDQALRYVAVPASGDDSRSASAPVICPTWTNS